MSALWDYMRNGGDELAAAKATIEHMGGCLGAEIAENKRLRETNAVMLAALKASVALADENLPGFPGRSGECQRIYEQCVDAIERAEAQT